MLRSVVASRLDPTGCSSAIGVPCRTSRGAANEIAPSAPDEAEDGWRVEDLLELPLIERAQAARPRPSVMVTKW